MKPATAKLHALRDKLRALAERGVNGERDAAMAKLSKLESRFDFSKPILRTADLFSGKFTPSTTARHVCRVPDFQIGNAVKWAIENASGIRCSFRDGCELWAEAGDRTAQRLETIAKIIGDGCTALWTRLRQEPSARDEDRNIFIRGIYDGMMEDDKAEAQALPKQIIATRNVKAKKKALNHAPGLAVHPYTLGVTLGRDIRFSVPLEEVTNRLEQAVTKKLKT